MAPQTSPPINPANVVTADAVVYVAPKGTLMPVDSATALFDASSWVGVTLALNSATAITLTVSNASGTVSTSSLTGATIATPGALQTALAALSNVGAGNVAVTGSAVAGYLVVFALGLGATTLSISAQTGGPATVSGGLWVPTGATEAGWTFGQTTQTQDITVEESTTPVNRFVTSKNIGVSGSMSEETDTNLAFALNALVTKIAAGAGTPGVSVLTLTDDLQHYACALETKNQFGLPTRVYIPDTVVTDSVQIAHRRAAAQHLLPVSFDAMCPTNQIQIRRVTAVPTS